jgi:hypothetical protein
MALAKGFDLLIGLCESGEKSLGIKAKQALDAVGGNAADLAQGLCKAFCVALGITQRAIPLMAEIVSDDHREDSRA